MIAIPNMEKPKKGEVIAFDGECAVYTDDDMQVHRYPLIEIDLVRCKDCKFQDECILGSYGVSEHGFCYKGERRTE